MANIFKEAKKIQRAHPKMDWQACIKAASRKHKKKPAKKKAARKNPNRQTGTSNRSRDEMVRAKAPGKRNGYYERRKNRSDAPGKLTGVTAASLTSELRRRLKDTLGKNLLAKDQAKKKTDKRRYQKQISETRKKLNKLS